MIKFVLVIHLLIAAAMIGIVLMQKSEGGALGIGGGGGGGGFLTGRGTANLLTRTTAILAVAFFITSLSLTWLAGGNTTNRSPVGQTTGAPTEGAPAPASGAKGLLDRLRSGQGATGVPSVPQNQ